LVKEIGPYDSNTMEPPEEGVSAWAKRYSTTFADMRIPSQWWSSSTDDKGTMPFNRHTGEWNKPLVDVLFAAYGKTPGPDFTDIPPPPPPALPYELKGPYKDGEFVYWNPPAKELDAAEKMVVEYTGTLNGGYSFVRADPSPWAQFDNGDKRITEDPGKLTFDMRGLEGDQLGFAVWGEGDNSKIKRVYIDTWAGSEAPNLATADTWARGHINEAYAKGFLPAALQGNYKANITRGEFVTLAMSWLNYKTGKANDQLVAGFAAFPDRTFTDTADPVILAAARLDITAGVGNDQFGVDGTFSRQQAAVMLTKVYRILGEDDANAPEFGFLDAGKAESWARNAINYVKHKGVMNGVGDGTSFDPLGLFQRQQSIIVFNQMG